MTTLNEAKNKVRELSKKGLAVAESKTLTFAEQKTALDTIEADIKQWMEEIKDLEFVEEKRKSFMAGAGNPIEEAGAEIKSGALTIGQQFVQSKGYKDMVRTGLKGSFKSGDVEIKTTLTISDLFPGGTTSTQLIRYLVETAVTNSAAAVAEGALAPESALSFSQVDEVLHQIKTFLPISDLMLEDWAQAQSYIDARLILFIKLAEETQLLNGDGTGSNLVGLMNRPGLAASVVKGAGTSAVTDNSMDAIYRQITAIRTTQWLEPDALAIDPLGWQNILLSKNSQGAYYANGPFASAETPTLWSKRVAVSPAIAANSALVGAFAQGGQVFRKGGITVEASNSHADYFQRGITAIRAEERLALAIYRPGAFGTVTGL
jgi:HK97 family phage major capsid protein